MNHPGRIRVLICDDDRPDLEHVGTETDARIIAFSAYSDHATVRAMKAAGASAFVVKGARNDRIVAAIRRVADPSDEPSPTRLGEVDFVQ